MEIRLLRGSDNRSSFRSGDPDLDGFLQKYAGQNQFRHQIGATYVAVEGNFIAGYATVAPGQLEMEALPAAQRRKLPRYPLPILRLARLTVDGRFRDWVLAGYCFALWWGWLSRWPGISVASAWWWTRSRGRFRSMRSLGLRRWRSLRGSPQCGRRRPPCSWLGRR